MRQIGYWCLGAVLLLTGCQSVEPIVPEGAQEPVAALLPQPPKLGLVRVLMTTSLGEVELELDGNRAPISVANFLAYVKKGHYEGTIFHRVIDGFVVQGGGFTRFMAQKSVLDPIENEAANGLKNVRGTIAMARTDQIDSATSQFFINLRDNDKLDYAGSTASRYGYAVFGRVVKGMEVVDRIGQVETRQQGFYNHVPCKPILIEGMKVLAAPGVP